MYLTVLYLRYMCEVDVNLQFIEICLFVSTVLYLTVLYRYMICLHSALPHSVVPEVHV